MLRKIIFKGVFAILFMYLGTILHPILIPRGTVMSVESPNGKYIAKLIWNLRGISGYYFYIDIYDKKKLRNIGVERYVFCDDVMPKTGDVKMQWEGDSIKIENDRIISCFSKQEYVGDTVIFHLKNYTR